MFLSLEIGSFALVPSSLILLPREQRTHPGASRHPSARGDFQMLQTTSNFHDRKLLKTPRVYRLQDIL